MTLQTQGPSSSHLNFLSRFYISSLIDANSMFSILFNEVSHECVTLVLHKVLKELQSGIQVPFTTDSLFESKSVTIILRQVQKVNILLKRGQAF